MECLKTFFYQSTSSEVKWRVNLMEEVDHLFVTKPGIPEPAVKMAIIALSHTLGQYHDINSRRKAESLLRTLLEKHKSVSYAFVLKVLADLAKVMCADNSCSRSNSGRALSALSWCQVVAESCLVDADSANWGKLIDVQAMLFYAVCSSQYKPICASGKRKLTAMWKRFSNAMDIYCKALLSGDPTIYKCVLLSAMLVYDRETLLSHKSEILSMYVKSVIMSKTAPKPSALICCKQILKEVSHTDFTETIFPALQKGLLRSPETVLLTIQNILSSLSIDLSRHSLALVKIIAPQLISKIDSNREVAVKAVVAMATECSDSDAVLETTKHLFVVLKGSLGKLTIVTQKCAVLEAIGGFSSCPVGSGSSANQLAANVSVLFIPFLQQEIHEGTLVTAATALNGWCKMFKSSVPKELIDWFVKAPGLKSSNPNVRAAYIACQISAFKSDTLPQIEPVIPYLIQTIEKATQQQTQIPLVTEALYASLLLSKLENVELTKTFKFGNFWNTIFDPKKSLFTSEKFLQHTPEGALFHLQNLVGYLLLEHSQKIPNDMTKQLYNCLIFALLHKSWELRKATKQTVRKLLSSLAGSQFSKDLLPMLFHIMRPSNVIDFSNVEDIAEAKKSYMAPKWFVDALFCLSNLPTLKDDKKMSLDIIFVLLVDSYHPCITEVNNHFFIDFLFKCGYNPQKFVKENLTEISKLIVKPEHHTKSSLAALGDFIGFAPNIMLPHLTEYALDVMNDHKFMQVTEREVKIMNTADGELWNIKIIDSAPKIVENKNVKRQNKTYSFKEQKEAEALQKELEQKKKGADPGGVKGSGSQKKTSPIPKNLSKKQKEMVEQELEKEAAIRQRLTELNDKFALLFNVLEVSFNTAINVIASEKYFVPLVDPLLNLLPSPLVSKQIQNLYILLSKSMMSVRKDLGLQVGYATLRMCEPACEVNPDWCCEKLPVVVTDLLSNFMTQQKAKYSTCAFAYIFAFLQRTLAKCGSIIESDSKLMCSILQYTLTHVRVRIGEDDLRSPELLPRANIMSSMCQLVGTSMVQVQHLASEVLLETCEAASAYEGCASASDEEINILLENLLSPAPVLRAVVLKSLLKLELVVDESNPNIIRRAWLAMHDVDAENRSHAKELWETFGFSLNENICHQLMEDIEHHEPVIQQSAADALAAALAEYPNIIPEILRELIDIYNKKLERPAPVLDQLGRVISESPPDQYQPRIGVAFAMKKISPLLEEDQVNLIFSFYVPDAVGDRHPEVRSNMLEAALQAVNDHGKKSSSVLLSILEDFLKNAPNSESYDVIRQSVVILIGTLARHLDKDDPKIKPIVAKLTETLSTPSQAVQEAVANCLPPLVPSIKDQAPIIVQKLLTILLESDNYGERKGAAYGLAGMVKGLGIISFKQHDIMSKLTEAVQDKKNFRHREGALLAFEMFCGMLGRLFEPYVVHVLPHLLICFGDGNTYVREAADNTAKAVMRNLSGHGVRLVLPSLLNALNEDLWRTKTGSAELLGAMAFCAPKQLSSCLPSIVPKLCEVLTDSHPKVQKAGQQALKQIGSVIRNPEIQAICPVLLAALSDPSRKTTECLQTLLNTKFIHFIDAPSLALILPVVQRAFLDRSMDTRKMAAQIIGNMYSLTDQKDLNPYLPAVIPGLKNTLLDPVPEVRAIAAKALGAMVKETGESQFKELLPWLMENLVSEQSSVDRSGAAQGLSEVLYALGTSQLTKLMPEVVRTAQEESILPHVREGYILLLVYLPTTFGDDFVPFIGDVIPPILKALADEAEFVRATALCAGQRIITMYSETAMPVLLPQLEKGLFDDNWRIRLSSIQLLGDLLYQITGVTGKMSAHGEEDDNFGTTEGFKALVETLGQERRDLVLSGLYMGRSDVALRVRQSSLHVWKIIVPNTPRVLREILPTLFKLLLGCLASSIYDKRQVAAKTLGDIVRKLGERMLPELIPILEKGLYSSDPSQREGVCIGLTEIIQSCSRDAIIVFTDNLVPTVRKALCDPLDGVREAAATTFEHLHNTIGVQALDEILPSLLRNLKNEETSEYAVDGLRQIIAIKGKVVLPFIVPKLVEPPINTEVLAFLSSVAGEALTRHLPTIMKALTTALINSMSDSEEFKVVLDDCGTVINSVEGEHGTRIVIDDLLSGLKQDNGNVRYASIVLLQTLCKNEETDYNDYVSVFLQSFIKLLADKQERIQQAAWDAMTSVTSNLDPADMQRHVSSVRHALRVVRNEELVLQTGTIPGFCQAKKGMSPLLPLFREGILNGSPELKEQSVKGLAECINYLTPVALKPSVTQITGPLIRILGDRYSSNVRIAFLETLALLLDKAGAFLKPFLPQLQTTFSKALQDQNRGVRMQAGTALSHLAAIHTRIDPLFADLNNNISNAEDLSVRETLLQALRGCINQGGKKMGSKVKQDILPTLVALLSSDEETSSRCAAGCLGNLCKFLDESEISQLMTQQIFVKDPSASWPLRQSRAALLASALKEACDNVYVAQWESKILEQVLAYTAMDRVQIVTHGIHCAAYLLRHVIRSSSEVPTNVTNSIKNGLEASSNDVKIETTKSLTWVMQQIQSSPVSNGHQNGDGDSEIPTSLLIRLNSFLLPMTREKNTAVKSAAEFALVSILKLRINDDLLQKCCAKMTSREASSLQELYKQKLKRIASSAETPEAIDDTILKS
uniref:Translational activator GCN1 n=1 Tax=Phallusia mammillata TaxID=59560 RepID=A0A6F9DDN9_9ASCI|nr:translational activator GCN1 [Phallusia mammillata]